jgi:predicted O-methyltransferase YrrM
VGTLNLTAEICSPMPAVLQFRCMNPVLEKLLKTQIVADDDGRTWPLVVHIPDAEGQFLQRVIRDVRPRISVEVGLAYGISTLYICEAMSEVGGLKHIVCDPDQFGGIGPGFHGVGLKNVRDSGFSSLVEFHPVSSHILLPQLEQQGIRVQFAFLDGWHTFDYTFVEFFYIDRILDVGGVVVFDDTKNYLAIRKVIRYVLGHRAYTFFGGDSCLVSWKRGLASLVGNLPLLRRIARPDVLIPDAARGFTGQFVALRKDRDDMLGNGTNGSRRWDQHVEF